MMENTFQGYIFMNDTEDRLRVLCQEDNALCLKEWNSNLDNSKVLIYWFDTCDRLKEYIKYSMELFAVFPEVQKLMQDNKFFAVKAEKNEKTGEISIL